jgi:hypothetical protein
MVRRVIAASAVTVVLVSPAAARAAGVPNVFTEQGRLLNASDNPITTAQTLQFAIYPVPAGGTAVWTEKQTITPDNGYFSAELGTVTPLDPSIFTGATMYLGLTVGSDAEMTPRQPMVSVPYAITASNAVGDITPASVTIATSSGTKVPVISGSGQWVGPTSGLAGPTGPVGPTGPMGPAGATGLVGPTGSAGAAGPAGAKGLTGPTGAQGVQGPVGPTGAAGQSVTGPVGPTGAPGATGPAGPNAAFAFTSLAEPPTLGTANSILLSLSYTAPSAGHVLLTATGFCNITFTAVGQEIAIWPATSTSAPFPYGSVALIQGNQASSVVQQLPWSAQVVSSVSAGSNTAYLMGNTTGGSVTCFGNLAVQFSASLL